MIGQLVADIPSGLSLTPPQEKLLGFFSIEMKLISEVKSFTSDLEQYNVLVH
jgi:hypothetical protein